MSDNSNDDAVHEALSGRGHRCVDASALVAFSNEMSALGAWVDIVETFEISEGLEIPRIDLSIYGDHGTYDLPAVERQGLAGRRLTEMLANAAKEPSEFRFDVWLDSDD